MFPQQPDELLQDTKNVPSAPVLAQNVRMLIVVLGIGVVLIGLWKIVEKRFLASHQPTQELALASTPTPAPATGTFVDSLSGTIIYLQDKALFEYQIGDRAQKQIVGIRPGDEVHSFFPGSSTWSSDGKYLAVLSDTTTVYVSEYDTGRFVGEFPLRSALQAGEAPIISFDPSNEVLSVGVHSPGGIQQESVLFFALGSQKELGYYPHCQSRGTWLAGIGFLTKCAIADSASITLVRFEVASSTMTPILREIPSTQYSLIAESQPGFVAALRTNAGKQDLVRINMKGQVSPLPSNSLPKGVQPLDIVDPEAALIRRIERETKIAGIHSVSVSSSNDWAAFDTDDGIYVTLLTLKEKPFFIGKGSFPQVRPY